MKISKLLDSSFWLIWEFGIYTVFIDLLGHQLMSHKTLLKWSYFLEQKSYFLMKIRPKMVLKVLFLITKIKWEPWNARFLIWIYLKVRSGTTRVSVSASCQFWTWELIWGKVKGVGVAPTHPPHLYSPGCFPILQCLEL